MKRCTWPKSESEIKYHDTEWCRPEHNDKKIFEFLVLEGAQAGLSWRTILDRRRGYKKAFANYDVKKVSRYTKRDVSRLLADESIIRNRLKISSVINNAKRFIEVQKEFGSFDEYMWGFVDCKPVLHGFKTHSQIPAYNRISEKMSRDLKKRGFTFVGPTICYSHMQATGMVNDHTRGCFLFKK